MPKITLFTVFACRLYGRRGIVVASTVIFIVGFARLVVHALLKLKPHKTLSKKLLQLKFLIFIKLLKFTKRGWQYWFLQLIKFKHLWFFGRLITTFKWLFFDKCMTIKKMCLLSLSVLQAVCKNKKICLKNANRPTTKASKSYNTDFLVPILYL